MKAELPEIGKEHSTVKEQIEETVHVIPYFGGDSLHRCSAALGSTVVNRISYGCSVREVRGCSAHAN